MMIATLPGRQMGASLSTRRERDMLRIRPVGVVGFLLAALGGPAARAVDIERAPINYGTAPTNNAVTRLQERINAGQVRLTYDDQVGYLRSLLAELKVPVSSQALVFSKTSLQRERIKPGTPRAVYFGDDVYVGFCQNGVVLEVTAIDPQLGSVFYSLDQEKTDKPKFTRQSDTCLICHSGSMNQGFPGQLVRSVYADADGYPVLASGRTASTTPAPWNTAGAAGTSPAPAASKSTWATWSSAAAAAPRTSTTRRT